MTESLEELLHREPFRPFRITLTSGQGYEVHNPALVVLQNTQIMYCYPRSDRWSVLRLNQIASLDVLEAAA